MPIENQRIKKDVMGNLLQGLFNFKNVMPSGLEVL